MRIRTLTALAALTLVLGCGHNRVNMHSTFGPAVSFPLGDLGQLTVSIGSSKTTSAMVRGGSSFTTESTEGGGLLSTAAGTTTISTFKSNTQLNEGNLVKVLTSSNVPDKAKIELAETLSKGVLAPSFEPAAMATREGMMYTHGFNKQIDYPFKSTGVDKIAETVTDVVEDTKEVVEDAIDRPLDSLDNTVQEVADGTARISRNAALVTILGILLSMLTIIVTFKKTPASVAAKKPSTVEAEGTSPPDDDPPSDGTIDIPEADEDPVVPEVEHLPWWKKYLLGLWSVIVSILTFWKGLPEEDQSKIRENLSKLRKKK